MSEFVTFKRWTLRDGREESELVKLVREGIVPHFSKLPGCLRLGLLRIHLCTVGSGRSSGSRVPSRPAGAQEPAGAFEDSTSRTHSSADRQTESGSRRLRATNPGTCCRPVGRSGCE